MNGKLMELVRAVVRPIITLSGWGTIVYSILTGGPELPEWFQTTTVGLTVWWFASRQTEGKAPP